MKRIGPGTLRLLGALKNKVYTGPETVHLHINNTCNLNCLYCWFHSPLIKNKQMKPKEMPFEAIKQVIDNCADLHVNTIRLSADGEPILHKDISKIIDYIKERNFNLVLLTNGTFEKNIMRSILKVDRYIVNLSASEKEIYNRLQSNGSSNLFKKVLKNLFYLSKIKHKNVQIEYVINKENYNYVADMIVLASKLDIDFVHFKIMDVVEHSKSLVIPEAEIDNFRKKIDIAIKKSEELKVKNNIELIKSIFSDKKFLENNQIRRLYSGNLNKVKKCFIGWYFSNIKLNGDVTPCCRNENLIAGNVYKKSFKEIWISNEFRKIRMLGKHKLKPGTRLWSDCNFCSYQRLNNEIAERIRHFDAYG